ncbi:hypothetical protein ACFMBG_09495 [Leisingera sp. D0M16]|uniref:hypothetical protein n=1 Tax=Leisingera coralii TaxID=3351347 RepID=UPI003B7D687C
MLLPDLRPPRPSFDRRIFESVRAEAAALRRSGALLRDAARIRCPVIALHGDHDPHPADSVEQPLPEVLPDFRFSLLQRCAPQTLDRDPCKD